MLQVNALILLTHPLIYLQITLLAYVLYPLTYLQGWKWHYNYSQANYGGPNFSHAVRFLGRVVKNVKFKIFPIEEGLYYN